MSKSIEQIALILEAALLVSDVPLSEKDFKKLFPEDEALDKETLHAALQTIEADCATRSYQLKEVASGWRF
ncbi:MAG: SMC-Scp complex subunit ScpB, partial [Pseudomonadota bacterium]